MWSKYATDAKEGEVHFFRDLSRIQFLLVNEPRKRSSLQVSYFLMKGTTWGPKAGIVACFTNSESKITGGMFRGAAGVYLGFPVSTDTVLGMFTPWGEP